MTHVHALTPGRLAAVLALAAIIVGAGFVGGGMRSAEAAPGDNLRTFTAAVPPCPDPPGISGGVAFTGSQLLLSCWNSTVIERVSPANGASLGSVNISGIPDISAMSWDPTRNKVWACSFGNIYLIDLVSGTAALRFATPGGCTTGVAFDRSDGTLWTACDQCDVITHWTATGAQLGAFPGMVAKLGTGATGLAATGGSLYVSNDGGGQIYRCTKDLTTCTLFASPGTPIIDLECDQRTFAGKVAIWSQNALGRVLTAWEADGGTCVAPPPPCHDTDVNDDGSVTYADVLLVLRHFGQTGPSPYDVDGSGKVDLRDVYLVLKDVLEGKDSCK